LNNIDQNKYQIQIPLPPQIDASVIMMQVEEKPDLTYSDVGGCKEQIEKLREVIETPLLSVSSVPRYCSPQTKTLITQNDLSMSEFDPLKDVLPYGTPGTGKTLCA
jgi:26S proteasome regulatory subunit T1